MAEFIKHALGICGEHWSYTTHVATIEDDKLIQLGHWSMATQTHINYVAKQFDLELIKP